MRVMDWIKSYPENKEPVRWSDNSNNSTSSEVIEVPDGGYGWVVLFAFFLFNISTFGANSSYAIYLAHYLEVDLYSGASKLDFAAIGGFSAGAGITLTPLICCMNRALPTRMTLSIGASLQCAGLLLAGFSTKLWQLYLTQGILVGVGMGIIFVTAYPIIPQWFREKRSLAVAIGAGGSGLGGVIFTLSVQAAIKNLGLKWAFFIQDICCTSMNIIGILLFKTRDDVIHTGHKIWDFKIMKTIVFYLAALYGFLAMQGYVVILFNLADFTRTLGYDSQESSIVASMVSVGAFFGRPLVGKISDIFGPVSTEILIHLIVSILCFAMWIPIRTLSAAILFALIQGSLIGSLWVVIGPMNTRIFGLRRLNTSLNMSWVFLGASSMVSPIVGNKLRGSPSAEKQYSPDQYIYPAVYCGLMYLGSASILFLVRGYLIARDEIAERQGSNEDNYELEIKVSTRSIFGNMLKKAHSRKV